MRKIKHERNATGCMQTQKDAQRKERANERRKRKQQKRRPLFFPLAWL